jgi:hypothetical protein
MLSLASGRARRVPAGTLSSRITEWQMLGGMTAGLATMMDVWGVPLPVAFTWYVFIGAGVTVAAAWALQMFDPSPAIRSR